MTSFADSRLARCCALQVRPKLGTDLWAGPRQEATPPLHTDTPHTRPHAKPKTAHDDTTNPPPSAVAARARVIALMRR